VRSLVKRLHPEAVDAFARSWSDGIGRGDGLTPYQDDIVCGSLLALTAAGHPAAASIAGEIESAPLERRTTAVSAALLRAAARGYCIEPLAAFLRALPGADDSPEAIAARDRALAALLAVGHSSGRGLAEGVRRMFEPPVHRLVAA
jgi:hypothetical protein